MLYQNAELHNVVELLAAPGGAGRHMLRIPDRLRPALNAAAESVPPIRRASLRRGRSCCGTGILPVSGCGAPNALKVLNTARMAAPPSLRFRR